MHGKEPIYNLIIEILSINAFNNNILRWIDLRANDSVDKSTVENTNYCIVNIAENSPIERMNVQERYLKIIFLIYPPEKGPAYLIQTSFTVLDHLSNGQHFAWPLEIKLRLALFPPQFVLARFFSLSRCSQRYALHLTSSLQVVVSLQTKWITP